MGSPFDPAFEDLPREISIFPLSGALLLPGGKLPLNIFEPRYLNMTLNALGDMRMIGMVQPSETGVGGAPKVYRTGCAGRITSFSETDDGRLLITLNGICRFDIVEELTPVNGYRRVSADFMRYRDDMAEDADDGGTIDRKRLLAALRAFLTAQGAEANWETIEQADTAQLVTSLAMNCPFQPSEKQAMLEAPHLADRAEVLVALLEMAARSGDGGVSH